MEVLEDDQIRERSRLSRGFISEICFIGISGMLWLGSVAIQALFRKHCVSVVTVSVLTLHRAVSC